LQTSRFVFEADPAQFEHEVPPLRQISRSRAVRHVLHRTVGISLVEKFMGLLPLVTSGASPLVPKLLALIPTATTTMEASNETTTILMWVIGSADRIELCMTFFFGIVVGSADL
jgi:hypothetical protein